MCVPIVTCHDADLHVCVYIHVYTYIYMYKYVNIDIHMYMYPLLSTHFIRIWELTESLKGYCNSENRLL